MLTLIYARYSSSLQNPRSIEDQLAACRARAAQEGWQVVGEFHDRAISGAAGIEDDQRPGLAAMLARLEGARFAGERIDQVLTESTDRIARHQGDAFAVRERIEHAGARLFTLMDGHVDDITGTIKGLFDARTRKDLAQRVKRGHAGNITQGRAASGVAYGYRKVIRHDDKGEPIRGLREIDPDTAPIVLRVYREYAAGRSARQIAEGLNRDGIPGPRGGFWRISAIATDRATALSLLTNPIYIGQLQYGRTRRVVDPRTRQRRTVRGTGDVVTGAAPHLRIVDDELWQAVQAQMERRSHGPSHRQRRPKRLMSGLGRCGVCGANYIVVGGPHFGCSAYTDGRACTNNRLIASDDFERRVLAELRDQMLAPEVVEAYLDEYRREHGRRARELTGERARLDRRIAEAARKTERLVAAIAEGGGEFAEIREALATAKADEAAARKALASADALPALALHPGLARQYRAAIERLSEELADETTRTETAPKIRALISHVIIRPGPKKRGVTLEVVRHIDEILTLATPRKAQLR